MSSRDFVYWLQGYFELSTPGTALSPAQADCIQRHLNLVFLHEIDPSEPGDPAVSQAVHDGPMDTPQEDKPPVRPNCHLNNYGHPKSEGLCRC